MIRETQLNFELTACAAHRRGDRISGTKAPCLVLECCQRTTPVQKSNGGYRHF